MKKTPFIVAVLVTIAVGPIVAIASVKSDDTPPEPETYRRSYTQDDAEQVVEVEQSHARNDQAAILVDGTVTLAEYQEAVRTTMACVDDGLQGLATEFGIAPTIQVTGPNTSKDQFEVNFHITVSSEQDISKSLPDNAQERLDGVNQKCNADHVVGVERAYRARLLGDPEYVRQTSAEFLRCLGSAGAAVPAGTSTWDALRGLWASDSQLTGEVRQCLEQYPSVTAVAPVVE